MDLADSIQEVVLMVDEKILELISEGETVPELQEAMKYSTARGKRIRAFLAFSSGKIFNVEEEYLLRVAVSLEMAHAYSLVHDDLPAMDNDDFRRGFPSTHKKYGQAEAILTGDALMTKAFDVLSSTKTHPDAVVRCNIIKALARASGDRGMIAGQFLDIKSESSDHLNIEEIRNVQLLKTGKLMGLSCVMGAMLASTNNIQRNALESFGQKFGLAYQIIDDIQDFTDDLEARRSTFATSLGLSRTKEYLLQVQEEALENLNIFGERANHLRELLDWVVAQA